MTCFRSFMVGPGWGGMAVRHEGAVDRADRVDEEAARHAEQPLAKDAKPAFRLGDPRCHEQQYRPKLAVYPAGGLQPPRRAGMIPEGSPPITLLRAHDCYHRLLRRCAYRPQGARRSEEHTSELQSLMRISYAVFCLKKTNKK